MLDAPNLTHNRWGWLTRRVHRGQECVGAVSPACRRRTILDDWHATQSPITCRKCLREGVQ